MPTIARAVELLVERPEIRLHTPEGATITLARPQQVDDESFTALAPRLRLSADQLWDARLTDEGTPYTAAVRLTDPQASGDGTRVRASVLDVQRAPGRCAERVAVGVPAGLRVSHSAFSLPPELHATLLNLSEDGAELSADAAFQPGDRITLATRILGHRLEARAIVTYAYRQGDGNQTTMGLFFLDDRRAATEPLIAAIEAARDAGSSDFAQDVGEAPRRRRWSLRRSG
jgi:hypothetical protein